MNDLLASTGAVFLAKASEEFVDAWVLTLFFKISAFFFAAFRIFVVLRDRANKSPKRPRSSSHMAPAEIAALVAKLAHQSLGVGPNQVDEPMEKLRIPRGDFLRFLDELEEDHGLSVPESARAMSSSISGVIAALCREG